MKIVCSHPNYYATEEGHIVGPRGKMLSEHTPRHGYPTTCVYPKKTVLVHRLVAEAFHGPCPDGYECDHINKNQTDNRPENLRWIPVTNNRSTGGSVKGKLQPKFTKKISFQERGQILLSVETDRQLAERLGVTVQGVRYHRCA